MPGPCPICGMQLTPVEIGDLATPAGAAGAAVRIDPVVVQNMGVRTTTVREGTLAVPIRTVGVLAEAEPARHDVNLRVSGWIERLHASTEGMHLAVGDHRVSHVEPTHVKIPVEPTAAAIDLDVQLGVHRRTVVVDHRRVLENLREAIELKPGRHQIDRRGCRRWIEPALGGPQLGWHPAVAPREIEDVFPGAIGVRGETAPDSG